MLVATVLSIGLLGPSAASGARLTLSVTSLSNPPATALTGGSLKVSYKVARQGSGLRGATLAFYLSPTKKKGRTAIRLTGGGSLAALKKKTSVKGTAKPSVPAGARLGSYYLLACVEKITPRQSRAKPACRSAKRKVRIRQGLRGIANPKPRTVTPVLDDARAATATIGSGGGTVTATGENGTVFTLTVPEGALGGDTAITMTPLASIGGLPFDGLVGGVDLKPDGLRFYKPVTLRFEPPSPLPVGRQAPFMYSGSGQDFHSYPLVRDPTKLEMTLTHFTGAGVADGSQAQQNAQENRAPANPEGQWEQRAAELIDDLREGRDDDFKKKFDALNREYYNVVVKPLLKAAETNDELAAHAISTFLSWVRQLQLLGVDDQAFEAEFDAGFESVRRILENAYRKAFERCVGGEIGQIQRLLGLARQAELLGYSFGQDIGDKLDRCVRFSLDYEADLYYESLYSGGDYLERGDLQVRTAAAPLRLNFANGRVEGDVPLTVESWEWFDYLCPRYGGTATPTRAGFAQLTVEIGNPIEERRADGSVRTTFPPPKILGLLLDPGDIDTRNDCGNGGDGSGGSREGFAGGFYPRVLRTVFAHLQSPIQGLYMINPWTFVGDDPWAEFTESRRVQQTERSHSLGTLRLRLHHTPQP